MNRFWRGIQRLSLELGLHGIDIARAHRVGRKDENKDTARTIVAKFISLKGKKHIFKKFYKLKGQRTFFLKAVLI